MVDLPNSEDPLWGSLQQAAAGQPEEWANTADDSLGRALAHIGSIPTHTNTIGGTLDPFQSASPEGWEYIANAVPYLAGTKALAKAAPKAAAIAKEAENAGSLLGIPAYLHEQVSNLTQPFTQAWNSGVMSSEGRENTRIEAERDANTLAFQRDPQGFLAQAKTQLDTYPTEGPGRAGRDRFMQTLPSAVINSLYSASMNTPNQVVQKTRASYSSGGAISDETRGILRKLKKIA